MKDIYDSKWITAEITDSGNRLWFVPIKFVIGDYFVADIDKKLYCFEIVGSRIKTHRQKLTRSFRVLQYDTKHYRPISPGNVKELEDVLLKNSLPKVNEKLSRIFKTLGSREKEPFEAHILEELVKELSEHENEFTEEVRNMTNYLAHLKADQIITPIKSVSEFIEDDLKATDPKFLGDVVSTYQRLDMEDKKITNTPITGKRNWFKIILIVSIIGLVGGLAYWAYASGVFSHGIPGMNFGQLNAQDIMSKYPTPEALKAAVDRGEINYNKLPPEVQKMVDSVQLPTVTPNP